MSSWTSLLFSGSAETTLIFWKESIIRILPILAIIKESWPASWVAWISRLSLFSIKEFLPRITLAFLILLRSTNWVVIAKVFSDFFIISSENFLCQDAYHRWFHRSFQKRLRYIIFNPEFIAFSRKNFLVIILVVVCTFLSLTLASAKNLVSPYLWSEVKVRFNSPLLIAIFPAPGETFMGHNLSKETVVVFLSLFHRSSIRKSFPLVVELGSILSELSENVIFARGHGSIFTLIFCSSSHGISEEISSFPAMFFDVRYTFALPFSTKREFVLEKFSHCLPFPSVDFFNTINWSNSSCAPKITLVVIGTSLPLLSLRTRSSGIAFFSFTSIPFVQLRK